MRGDTLIVEVGDTQTGNVKGFSKRAGEELWSSDCSDEAGHSGGIVPLQVNGVPCAMLLTMRRLLIIRLDAGREGQTFAELDWTTDFANNIKLGDGLQEGITMGPMANSRRLDALESFVNDAKNRGGKIVTGGKRHGNQGFFFEPTIVTDVPDDSKVMTEEPFGPIAPIVPFKSFDEVVVPHLDTAYRLACWLLRNEHDAEDAVQDALIRALDAMPDEPAAADLARQLRAAARRAGTGVIFDPALPPLDLSAAHVVFATHGMSMPKRHELNSDRQLAQLPFAALFGRAVLTLTAVVAKAVAFEDARFVFPNATRTNLIMTTNLRALIHMSGLRLCTMAQWEIRRLFQLIRHEIFAVSPFLGSFLAPKCVPLGYCDEDRNRDGHCPIRPHKDEVLAAWAEKRAALKAAGRELPTV